MKHQTQNRVPVEESPFYRIGFMKVEIRHLRAALEKIVETAPANGEDCSYIIAKRALDLSEGMAGAT